ncbi:hypothetical protein [Seohaeicola zhoushanensis]|uniref:Uncharacterized protein n=1 Tax=Seohaeicola zhoushanensis TaxID=1569283 RepID=A0A8J3GVE1_9RHOB|nr:hypothetical protein [Seohaeicola zhoushanensis]GHF41240.1 hypothetical protein GCM10017056_11060 [Seohaeicola zhoushanensis]
MHAYDIMVLVSTACMVAFVSMMASRESLALYLAYVVAAVGGTFGGGWAGFHLLPIHPQFALIFGALVGGALCAMLAARLMRGR